MGELLGAHTKPKELLLGEVVSVACSFLGLSVHTVSVWWLLRPFLTE